jgi:hypothetical protein
MPSAQICDWQSCERKQRPPFAAGAGVVQRPPWHTAVPQQSVSARHPISHAPALQTDPHAHWRSLEHARVQSPVRQVNDSPAYAALASLHAWSDAHLHSPVS